MIIYVITDEMRERLVQPFYRDMMMTRSVDHYESLLPGIAEIATTATAYEVICLLRSHWREQVMGAWFSVRHFEDHTVISELLKALGLCAGILTAAPLAVAASLAAKDGAMSIIRSSDWLSVDLSHHEDFVASLITYLEGTAARTEVEAQMHQTFSQMADIAADLQSQY